ncbi:MAG: tRNA 2-thiouridine(34) synthase MnmA [Minisyncoccia bacterium]
MSNIIKKSKKVVIAMSGGVDSSVAAALLKSHGYEVVGVFMRLGIAGNNESEKSARAVAEKLGIKFCVLNLRKEFKKKIIDYFVSEYQKGRTPNPCVRCNQEIKFGLLMDKVLSMGADFIATGHYAKSQKSIKSIKSKVVYKLLKAKDINKDQSYFLYTLTQKKLKRCLFPIGDYQKSEVRELAKGYGLAIHDRKESQEICFIQTKYYGDFLKKYLKLAPGDIVNEKKEVLGKHKGLPLYTIGQRRDIGIGGIGPYYVVKMDYKKNQLVVSNDMKNSNLFSREIILEKVVWNAGKAPKLPMRIKAKIRYRMEECSAVVEKISGKYQVKFSKPQRAAMPGQSVVFYKGQEVLGGGIIKQVRSEK